MVSCLLQGGLGNQMFQISATYALSIKNNDISGFNFNACYTPNQGYPSNKYKDNVFKKINNIESYNYSVIYNEKKFSFDEIPYQKNMLLNGFFQSEKYFYEYRNNILDMFEPTESVLKKIKENYGSILLNNNLCSIHVRRGDYLKNQNFHYVQPLEYYVKAIKLLKDIDVFLIFSDDILWCKENFNFIDKKIFIENLEDFEELYLMSLCKNNIVSNSTFSWWGAWLNKNKTKKIISPKKWFGESATVDSTDDLIPKDWIIID